MESVQDAGIVLLSPMQDTFYAKNMYANFGEIGQNIKELMTDFQRKAQTNQKLESIADMKNFVEQYPQFRKISGTVSKHVMVVGELSRIVSSNSLLEVSEVEQQVACDGEHSHCLNDIRRLLQNQHITDIDACRLVMLYALRFETHTNNDISGLVQLLKRRTSNTRLISAVRAVLDFAGASRRQNDLFGGSAMAMTKRIIKGLKGVENIYTQHEPYLCQLIDSIAKGRLSETAYPHVTAAHSNRIDNVIVFIIGGATYEESRAVYSANERKRTGSGGGNSPAVLLLSTCMLNAKRFGFFIYFMHSFEFCSVSSFVCNSKLFSNLQN
ncbi:unnamed protein product [Anisakis simplex]|uniref:Vacuolar protein sorting-associated protein 45 n=1 Tax=Anisakis simplex TaxID=6269 RepID=A0A0M3J4X5_ANISI|nr:unnamed protein product [Anisakis simplex]